MLTDDELRQIMPNCPATKRAAYLPHLQQAMQEFGITSYLREAAFIAQLAHESAELRFMEEIASGAAYEGRADLGNTQPGDGKRFKGRGPIQLTGRANYRTYGAKLGVDLINDPAVAATPEVGFRIAGLFWQSNGLNELADQERFKTITKRINGGHRGLADRIKYYERAKRILSRGDSQFAPVDEPEPADSFVPGLPPAYPGMSLRQGSSGPAVRAIQQRLGELGFACTVDGNFGPGTHAAVVACQKKNNLPGDGVVGPRSWAAFWAS